MCLPRPFYSTFNKYPLPRCPWPHGSLEEEVSFSGTQVLTGAVDLFVGSQGNSSNSGCFVLDCRLGSLDLHFLVEIKLGFLPNPQKVINFLQGARSSNQVFDWEGRLNEVSTSGDGLWARWYTEVSAGQNASAPGGRCGESDWVLQVSTSSKSDDSPLKPETPANKLGLIHMGLT